MKRYKNIVTEQEGLLQSFLFETMENITNWNQYMELVAQAYEEAPENDPEATKAFESMKNTFLKHFRMIESKIKVLFVDGDPYKSSEEMQQDVKQNKQLKIMKDFSDHPFFSKEENWRFRAVHDWFTHILTNQPFTAKGELKAYNVHLKMFPPSSWPALFTEIVGQVSYVTVKGGFPTQKVCILKGFDYGNLGRVEGWMTDKKNRMIVKKDQVVDQEQPAV